MASNSKRSTNDKTKFTEAEKNWHLEKLYEDLRAAKQRCGSVKRKVLTDIEKCYLRGLLCGCSDQEIANERGVVVGTVSDALSKTLYRYIEELLNYTKEIRHWGDVPDFLDQAGYKIQVSEQSQPSHPLPDKQEKTLEASHKIEANSIREWLFKSIDQLWSKDISEHKAAISKLERIAKDYSTEHWGIMEELAKFIKANAPRKEEVEEERSLKLREDIQAALTVIGRRDSKQDPENQRLILRNTDLRGAILKEANLQGVNFYAANLQGIFLNAANLQGAILEKANLQKAFLSKAILHKASFYEADLQEAFLNGANLQEADLYGANLQEAVLDRADLQEAFLNGANLRGASFIGANLQNAHLYSVKNLKLWQIEKAFGNSATVIPANLERPANWM